MKRLLLVLVLLPLFCFPQKQGNIWYFGNHAGVDFNGGIPVPLTNGATFNSQNHSEGTSVISDSAGNLLFYTNGQKIWNKNHLVMPNGDSLLGNFSSTQSSVIVPEPGSSRFFYVFTVDDYFMSNLKYGFRYSVVDICLDNGLGNVVPNQKNIALIDSVAEKVAVVRHLNSIDYWVITHKVFSNAFYSFLLTSNGISDTIITQIGSTYTGFQGQLKISPDGNTIAMGANYSSYLLDLFDFDKSTGNISNYRTLVRPYNSNSGIYGVEFSPDNSKLYCFFYRTASIGTGIVQYDLSAGGGNLNSINNSMNIIYDNPNVGTIKALQLGPDGKIYFVSLLNKNYLCAINDPNNYGPSCNFQDTVVYLAGKQGDDGLPTFITNYEYSNTSYNCLVTLNEQRNISEEILVFPNPFIDFIQINFVNQYSCLEFALIDIFGKLVFFNTVKNNDIIELDKVKTRYSIYFYQLIDKKTKKMVTTGKLLRE